MSYTTTAKVRLMQVNFTVGNIPDDNITEFITKAGKYINALLGVTTDLSATEITECNADEVANLYCAVQCCDFAPSTLFANNSEYAMQLDAFYARLAKAEDKLVNIKGTAVAPSTLFRPMSTS
ncbi:MAG: hypothetical protein P9X24_04575 [Candidatus Hatepunaea meridiana]|nr:hypothetical protein [Candidatus Hatepunaea meridiana]